MSEYRGTSSLTAGTVIASRYEVVKCLGTGSMGMVYACRKRGAPESPLVAIKVLFSDVASGDKVKATRFRKEIFAAFGVDHPNVVKAWEYIRDGDIIAYSMELISGGDLATKLGRNSVLFPIPQCVKMLRQMCAGVHAIHEAGIVHRDLKPENILLTEDGDLKIADFGIARIDMGIPRNLTKNGGVLGTIDYVAPEYLMSSQIDARADIYAVGVLGYEIITGESPFRGDSVYDTLWKRAEVPPPPPMRIRPECPASLDAIINKALAIKPEERFQSAKDMLDELQALTEKILDKGTFLERDEQGNPQIGGTESLEKERTRFSSPYLLQNSARNLEPQLQIPHSRSSTNINNINNQPGIAKEDPLGPKSGKNKTLNTNSSSAKILPHASGLSQLEANATRASSIIALRRSELFLLLTTIVIVISLGLMLELFEIFPIPH